MGEAEEEGEHRGASGYQKGDGMEEKDSDKLLSAAGGKGYREMVGEQNRAVRVRHLSEV